MAPLLRSLVAVLLAARLGARTSIPSSRAPAVQARVPAGSINAAPDINGQGQLLQFPAGLAVPEASSSDRARAASRELSEAHGKDAASAVEASGRHFDGLKAAAQAVAAPEISGAEQSGRHAAPLSSVLPDTVKFHGLTLPAAQFSEEGPGWMSSKLIAAINATEKTLDLALLEVMHRDLVEAVLAARDRGVKIRFVFDLDGRLLQNGSYNWTDGARFNNFENIQFFTEKGMVGMYRSA